MLRPVILGPVHLHGLKKYLSTETLASPFPAGMGGYSINSLIEARLLHGWKTDVVTLDPNVKDDITRMVGPLLRIWVVRRRKSGAVRDLFAAEQRLMMAAVAEAKPDLIHANWTYEYGLTAVRQSSYPYLLTVRDHSLHCLRWLGWRYLPLYLITEYVLRRSRHLTAVSPYIGSYLEQKLHRPVQFVPNLLAKFALELVQVGRLAQCESHSASGTFRIVSAVNWSDLKNVRNALRAFRRARRMCHKQAVNLNYTLIGPGLEQGGPAETWALRHNCTQGVIFKGSVTHEDALREIATANVLFHPSHEESVGGPILEAMTMRVPVVACWEAGGSRWLCGNDRGLLCDGHDPGDMATQIVEACIHQRADRCAAAYDWLAGLASDDKVLDALMLAYTKACSTCDC
ncbi:MAG: glycosyltransferase family 4 protein [Pedobacter sp.]